MVIRLQIVDYLGPLSPSFLSSSSFFSLQLLVAFFVPVSLGSLGSPLRGTGACVVIKTGEQSPSNIHL